MKRSRKNRIETTNLTAAKCQINAIFKSLPIFFLFTVAAASTRFGSRWLNKTLTFIDHVGPYRANRVYRLADGI